MKIKKIVAETEHVRLVLYPPIVGDQQICVMVEPLSSLPSSLGADDLQILIEQVKPLLTGENLVKSSG